MGLMQWISGKLILVDARTKRNVRIYGSLNKIMTEGKIDMVMFRNAKRMRFKT